MAKMLASVMSLDEAWLAVETGVDIIDLKRPDRGALGALDIATVKEIVAAIGSRRPISATIGDLPMEPGIISNAVAAMAATGVDYVKMGIFAGGEPLPAIEQLSVLTKQGVHLVAVLFADQQPDWALLPALRTAHFKGAMLDTAGKGKGSLTGVLPDAEIKKFVALTKGLGLLCGLAGSLRRQDVAGLLPMQPDFLGFRGALCEASIRTGRLDRDAITQLRQAIIDFDHS